MYAAEAAPVKMAEGQPYWIRLHVNVGGEEGIVETELNNLLAVHVGGLRRRNLFLFVMTCGLQRKRPNKTRNCEHIQLSSLFHPQTSHLSEF